MKARRQVRRIHLHTIFIFSLPAYCYIFHGFSSTGFCFCRVVYFYAEKISLWNNTILTRTLPKSVGSVSHPKIFIISNICDTYKGQFKLMIYLKDVNHNKININSTEPQRMSRILFWLLPITNFHEIEIIVYSLNNNILCQSFLFTWIPLPLDGV